jgi:prolyl-tRNA editing enzyme YbaK/EbsC (Cys-tRNA(Pro) deacylase)
MCGAELLSLPEGVQKVAALLQAKEHPHAPIMLDDAARTAQQAAVALGVGIGQIAKSIVFRRKSDDAAVLVVTSGDQRVDEKKLEALVCPDGKRLSRANADFVKTKTGFSIGGVSPLAHATPVLLLIDQSLFRFDQIWAAAGHPNAVFQLTPTEMEWLTGAPVVDVAVNPVEEQLSQQSAITLVAARARKMAATGEILSPCISVCRMHAATAVCEGCFRTRDEIAAWGNESDKAKRGIWVRIEERMAAVQA